MSTFQLFTAPASFVLESGEEIKQLEIAYTTLGKRAPDDSNVVWIFHALTANSDPHDWWPGMVGEGKTFDPQREFIICANVLASSYGSSGPLSENTSTGQAWYADFPLVTIRDIVAAHRLLQDNLGIRKIRCAIGASLGGQQALEWALLDPDLFENLILLATNGVHSPWGRAFNTSQRMALEADSTLRDAAPSAGRHGLEAARAIAMLSYRTQAAFAATQDDANSPLHSYRADSYLRYQGRKLSERFSAWSYYRLTQAMDSHDVSRGRGTFSEVLARVRARTLVLGISSDGLFPPQEQRFLAEHIPGANYSEIHSQFGHDGFLVEAVQLNTLIPQFLQNTVVTQEPLQ